MGIFSKIYKKRIYADWAATTPIHPHVMKAMSHARKVWANPNAIHAEGVAARKVLEGARERAARLIGVKPAEIYFTSGGTEANGTLIQGVIRTKLEKGVMPKDVHVVSTSIEHSSILETLKLFEAHGVRVTYVNPDPHGIVRVEDIVSAITPQTVLVTCMYANNEIGTIQPVSKIGSEIRKIKAARFAADDDFDEHFPVFHVDASQAPLWLSCDIEGLRADALTLDAHKMQGPKAIGALVVRHHVAWQPLMVGGGQERGKRPTTEAVDLIVGFAEALTVAHENRTSRVKQATAVRDHFFDRISRDLPRAVINGSTDKRLPNNVNLSLPDISDPELAVLFLDKEGIACSTKSSCLKGEEDSYVVKSLGGEPWTARNTLRFTLAPNATVSDVSDIVEALKKLPKLVY